MNLSFSRLQTYEQCPRKLQLRYVAQVPEQPSGSLIGGRVVHRCMERGEQEQLWREEPGIATTRLDEMFRREFNAELLSIDQSQIRWGGRKTKQYPDGEDAQWWHFMGPVMLKRWAIIRREDQHAGIEIAREAVEIEVSMTIAGSLVRGFVDAMPMLQPTGHPFVRDYKTGKMNDPFQLATYARLWSEMSGVPVTHGEFVKLRATERAKQIERHDLTPWLPIVEQVYGEAVRAIEISEQTDVWPMKRSSFCKSCTVRMHCPWGSTLDDTIGEDA